MTSYLPMRLEIFQVDNTSTHEHKTKELIHHALSARLGFQKDPQPTWSYEELLHFCQEVFALYMPEQHEIRFGPSNNATIPIVERNNTPTIFPQTVIQWVVGELIVDVQV